MKKMITMMTMGLMGLIQAAELPIDKDHTSVSFRIQHMMVSRVTGTFTEFDGTIMVEDEELKGVKGEVQVSSIDTGNERRDNHLRSDDFFDADAHSVMKLESVRMENGKLIANLTIKGNTHEVAFDYDFNGPRVDPWGNTRYGLTLRGEINRTDFGLTWNQALEAGGVLVGETVHIEISAGAIAGE